MLLDGSTVHGNRSTVLTPPTVSAVSSASSRALRAASSRDPVE